MTTTVYILGAGCSAAAGYPLASNFSSALQQFGSGLGTDCDQIKGCISRTVDLMASNPRIRTIDDLLSHVMDGRFDGARQSTERITFRSRTVMDAKIATAAFFLELERQAAVRMQRYDEFILRVLPPPGEWWERLQAANARVITFNYDRLFEWAFRYRFSKVNDTVLLYGKDVLNSGFADTLGQTLDFAPDRFCLLKMHGSVGVYAYDHDGRGPSYLPYRDGDPGAPPVITDGLFFAKGNRYREEEPLIVFPPEKSIIEPNRRSARRYADYIVKVRAQAARLIAEAKRIWIIGYSFNYVDPEIPPMLRQAAACEKIIIQNRQPEIDRIMLELSQSYGINIPMEGRPSDF